MVSLLALFIMATLAGHAAAAPACSAMLANPPVTAAYPFAPFMACLNNTVLGLSLSRQMAALAKGSAALHSLGPVQRGSLAAISEVANVTRLSLFRQYLDYHRAFSLAHDKHFAFLGLPNMVYVDVVRPVYLGIRESAGGHGAIEVYVAGILREDVVASLQALPALAGEAHTIPDYDALYASYGKTVVRINGRDAVEWARAQAALIATESRSTNLNVAASWSFFAYVDETLDLTSPSETFEFDDGTGYTSLRWVYRPHIPDSYFSRCDLSTTPAADTNSALRNEAGETPTPTPAPVSSHTTRAGHPALTSPSERALRTALRHKAVAPGVKRPLNTQTVTQHAYEAAGLQQPDDGNTSTTATPAAPASRRSAEATTNTVLQEANGEAIPMWYQDSDFAETYVGDVNGRVVAVLRLKTFAPASLDASTSVLQAFEPFYNQLDGLMNASAGVTTELLMDTASNTGGYIALAELTLRALDPEYNLMWETKPDGDTPASDPPRLINVTAKNTQLLRAYLRPSQLAPDSPMRNYYPNLLNDPYVYGEATAHGRDWFLPVGREGFTAVFQRPSLFSVLRAESSPYRAVRILSDGFCGSACCMVVERIKRYGLLFAPVVEFIGFGGDPNDSRFQMGVFCGGSVMQTSCAASEAGLTSNPFMTSPADFDATFVNTVWFATRATQVPTQVQMQSFATRVIRDWSSVGDSQKAHNRRIALVTQPAYMTNRRAGSIRRAGDTETSITNSARSPLVAGSIGLAAAVALWAVS